MVDKFSHTHEIINLVSREFPIQNALPTARVQTPAQIAELANAPASSSAKSSKTNVKSKNKDSPRACVTGNPYYPYDQDFFGHDEESPDLVDD